MELKVGVKAPEFEGIDQDGNTIKLTDYRGKKVIVYFYPNDDTPGCTAQSCNLRDNYDALLKQGYVVLGISHNDEKSHRKFIKKFNLPFPLIADTDVSINEQYGVWKQKSMFGKKFMGTIRTTFIVNEEGVLEEIITKVNTENHTTQILK